MTDEEIKQLIEKIHTLVYREGYEKGMEDMALQKDDDFAMCVAYRCISDIVLHPENHPYDETLEDRWNTIVMRVKKTEEKLKEIRGY